MKKRSYIPLLIFLWAVVPCYIFTQNTFGEGASSASWYIAYTFLQSIVTIAVLNFSAYFLGGLFFRSIDLNKRSFPLKRLYKIAAGYGIIFISLTLLGVLGLYTPLILNLYIIVLTAFSIIGVYEFIEELPINRALTFSGTQTVIISVTAFVILLDLIVTLTPPTVRDSLIHHLAVPKIYLKKGGIVDLDFMIYSFRSLNLEILYVLALFIKNDIIARVMHFNFYLLSVITLYHFLRASFSKTTALTGMMVFASIPVVFRVASSAYVDLGLTFFAIMLLNAIVQYYREEDDIYLKLGGLSAGLCISTKINGYLFVFLMMLWLVLTTQRHKLEIKKVLKGIGIFLLFMLIFDSHLIVKNLVQSKNPFYPALKLTTGATYQAGGEEVKLSSAEIRKLLHDQTLKDELLLPWDLSTKVKSKVFYMVDGVLGPIFIIFLPFIVFVKRRRYEVYSLLVISAVYVAVCQGKFDIRLRYLFVLFPAGIFMISAVIDEFIDKAGELCRLEQYFSRLIYLILFFLVTINAYHIFDYVSIREPFEFITRKVSREQYLNKHYKRYKVFKYINENITEPGALIYFLDFGNDGYYCDVDYFYDSVFLGRTLESMVKNSKDADELYDKIRKRGITHILLNRQYLDEDLANNYEVRKQKIVFHFLKKYVKLLKQFKNEKNFIFEVRKNI